MPVITGLTDDQAVQLALSLADRKECVDFHNHVRKTRSVINGTYEIEIPESHRTLMASANYEGSLRLDARIEQAVSWLASAAFRVHVGFGGPELRDEANSMARFARYGEKLLSRGPQMANWRLGAIRDFFETGMAVVQQNPRGDFYLGVKGDPKKIREAKKLTDVIWRRRVDPLYFWWQPGPDGDNEVTMIKSQREVREVARIADRDRINDLKGLGLRWVERFQDNPWEQSGMTDEVTELWVGDAGYLIANGGPKNRLPADDPRRVIQRWANHADHPPHYVITAGKQPYRSPLNEMYQLTQERNYWATMLDLQAAGAIFRYWQLVDDNTGDPVSLSLFANQVPENLLLNMAEAPPHMGPGTRWELAPFEFHDVEPRYARIVQQHEDAGAAVARLMGSNVGEYTPVGTADIIEEQARREFHRVIEAFESCYEQMWEDYFRWHKDFHPGPIYVSERKRDREGGQFFNTSLELRPRDIVSEDVAVTLDTRSRVGLIADYRLGLEMSLNNDASYETRVENGMIPHVTDPKEEVADIYVSQLEKAILTIRGESALREIEASINGPNTPPSGAAQAPTPGVPMRPIDERGSGVGQGANNISNTALEDGAVDARRVA